MTELQTRSVQFLPELSTVLLAQICPGMVGEAQSVASCVLNRTCVGVVGDGAVVEPASVVFDVDFGDRSP